MVIWFVLCDSFFFSLSLSIFIYLFRISRCVFVRVRCRYMPPVTPSAWKSTRLADRFSPVCPQLPPVSPTGREALLEVPRERLAQIRRLLPLLSNQSEDCLYVNLYVPRTG